MRAAIRAPVLGDARTRWEFLDPGCARFELALVVHEGEDGLTGALELDLGRFARESGPRLAAAYVALVEAIVARPAVRLAELCAAASARLVRPRRASEDAA
jgi:non-ribosomal peptide synthetase component F